MIPSSRIYSPITENDLTCPDRFNWDRSGSYSSLRGWDHTPATLRSCKKLHYSQNHYTIITPNYYLKQGLAPTFGNSLKLDIVKLFEKPLVKAQCWKQIMLDNFVLDRDSCIVVAGLSTN